MGGSAYCRAALLVGGAVAAALLGPAFARAEDEPATTLAAPAAAELDMDGGQIDFTDPQTVFSTNSVSVHHDAPERFAPGGAHTQSAEGPRRVELEFAAGDGDLDVSFAQRASLGAGSDGDIDRRGRGSEVRIGRGLVEQRDGNLQRSSTYVFVASDNEALTWQPGQRSEFGGQGSSFAMQDRVEVGDLSAGVTYERNGIQASLAYVEREESTTVGQQSFSQDESFTGVTVTMRR